MRAENGLTATGSMSFELTGLANSSTRLYSSWGLYVNS
jgi:hypothetical protein